MVNNLVDVSQCVYKSMSFLESIKKCRNILKIYKVNKLPRSLKFIISVPENVRKYFKRIYSY